MDTKENMGANSFDPKDNKTEGSNDEHTQNPI